MRRKLAHFFVNFCLIGIIVYGVGRLYFDATAGFTEGNIISEYKPDPRWETHSLSSEEENLIETAITQPYTYLGKGCQSYVFLSEDKQFVLKFFKYQRFRTQAWMDYFSFIPKMDQIRKKKMEKKQKKLDGVYSSWKIGFDHLIPETGLVYVHLNKTDHLHKKLTIYDKMGWKHELDADKMEFLIQKRADMLCSTLDKLPEEQAKQLLTDLIQMIASEYSRGFADNDHALMQNTGVSEGKPVHIDVGQFVIDESMKDPSHSRQEIFNKTFKFRIWLEKAHPELLPHLDKELVSVLGEHFHTLTHKPKPK